MPFDSSILIAEFKQHDVEMSSPSASGDEIHGASLRGGEESIEVPFSGGPSHTRCDSELYQDGAPSDTTVVKKRHRDVATLEDQAVIHSQAQSRSKQPIHRANSKRAKIPPRKKVSFPSDEKPLPSDEKPLPSDKKPHSGAMDLGDEQMSSPDSLEDDSEHDSADAFTIYDAVAGRLGYEGLIKHNQQPVSAAEYLSRYQRDVQRDQNYENLSAHRHLEHPLPDSDLLKAIHAHASDFYGALPDAKDSFESMDETALIAMGILLEELTAERLGKTGDLAFVEAAQPGEADTPKLVDRKAKRQKIKHGGHVKSERGIKGESGSSDEKSSLNDRCRSSGQKRRRQAGIDKSDTGTEDEAEHTEDDPSHNDEVESWISQTLLDSQGGLSSQFGTGADLPIR